jgi:SAM-dependent methyltransferase
VDPSTYGDRIADVYDDWYADVSDVAGTVAMLRGLGTSVLELGIGTGRLAIPMADAGMHVTGIDASPAMVERLRAKDGDRIPVVVADFVDVPVDGAFDVALFAFNTFTMLVDVDAQVRCLRRCGELAAHVVIETFVPGDDAPSQGIDVRTIADDEVTLTAFRVEDGVVSGSIVSITESGIRLRPWRNRLLSLDELDEAAARSDLELVSRRAGWRDEPFGPESTRCVTVYRSRWRYRQATCPP